MKKFLVILASAVLLSAPTAYAQEKAVPTDTTIAQATNLNAPPSTGFTSPLPADGAGATTMSPVKGKITVPAELVVTLPDTLKGQWTGDKYSQAWSVKKVDGRWLLEWWRATKYGCNITDAPAIVKMKSATTLEISMPAFECMKDFVAVLEKSGDGFKGRASIDTGMKLDVMVTLR